MSEMLANQYFISGRYGDALEQYLVLPPEQQNNLIIKEKMLISATLDENFENAFSLLKELILNESNLFSAIKINVEKCPCTELANMLENQKEQKQEYDDTKKMKIAILNFFYAQDKSLEYFKTLKNSDYSEIVSPFLKSIEKITQ